MRPRLVGAKRRQHLLERQAARQTHRERRHEIFDVVRAAQFRVRHPEDRRVLINDRSAFEAKIRLVRVGAEGDRPRRDFRQRFAGIDDRDVIRRLIFKNAQLGRAIFRDRAIAIEMVRGKIQPDADRRPEGPNGFELERAHFHREHIEVIAVPARLRRAVCRCCRKRWCVDRRHSTSGRATPSWSSFRSCR